MIVWTDPELVEFGQQPRFGGVIVVAFELSEPSIVVQSGIVDLLLDVDAWGILQIGSALEGRTHEGDTPSVRSSPASGCVSQAHRHSWRYNETYEWMLGSDSVRLCRAEVLIEQS